MEEKRKEEERKIKTREEQKIREKEKDKNEEEEIQERNEEERRKRGRLKGMLICTHRVYYVKWVSVNV